MTGAATPAIFVFGSNLAGRHGRGAALEAVRRHGARYGQGSGPQGNAYALPTKDWQLRTLPLEAISVHVREFLAHARANPSQEFFVTDVGCGLAGYLPEQIAPLFRGAPGNCRFSERFQQLLTAGVAA